MVIRGLMALYVHPELVPLSGGPEVWLIQFRMKDKPSTPQMVWNPDSRPEGTTAIVGSTYFGLAFLFRFDVCISPSSGVAGRGG